MKTFLFILKEVSHIVLEIRDHENIIKKFIEKPYLNRTLVKNLTFKNGRPVSISIFEKCK